MSIDHTAGERFSGRGYLEEDLRETVQEICQCDSIYISARTTIRLQDLGINLLELENSILEGELTEFEITPSKWEIRMEFHLKLGDMNNYKPVVYLSKDHELFCEDVRTI